MTMMITDFEPSLLSPLTSETCMAPSAHFLPRPPSPRKRTSDRVSTLLLDNLELFDAPLITNSSSNKAPRLELSFQNTNNVNNNKNALMENALQRLREKAASTTTAPVVLQQQHRQRRAPTLPERRPSPRSRRNNDGIDGSDSLSSSSSSSSSTNNSNKVDMDSPATPIRSPPVRSNSGLARCA